MIEVKRKNQSEFVVEVQEKSSKTEHLVTLDDDYYQLLTQGKSTKEDLIKRTFQFLLRREPKESILSTFNLKTVKQYFPEFEKEITKV